jgi:small subunit ribosomal protein S15Ae
MYLHFLISTGYIGEFEEIDDHRSGKIVIQLNGRLNKTGVISPRFNVQVTQIESWVNLLLPARGFGIIILVSYPVTCCDCDFQFANTYLFVDDIVRYPRSR